VIRRLVNLFAAPIAVAVEYGVHVHGEVFRDGDTFSREYQENRLRLMREIWPDAELVSRNVYYGEWKEPS